MPTPGQHVNRLDLSYLAEYLKSRGKIIALEGNLISAVDDPNFEGAMSFFFAGKFPLIPSGDGELNFVEQIKNTKNHRNR